MREGVLLDAASIPLEANGQTAWLIDAAFPAADTSNFAGAGNLFIADWVNHRIRKVDSAGVITTIAGTGRRVFGGNNGDGGPALHAHLALPTGVAVDGAGNLFIADSFTARIRRVDSAGVITTVAGTGGNGFSGDGGPATAARLYGPRAVAVDGAGNLFIADGGNRLIRILKPAVH